MNSLNKFVALIILFLSAIQIFPQDQNVISKSFPGFSQLKIKTSSSDFSLKPSSDSLIHIICNFTYNPNKYKPKIDSNKNTIIIDDSFFTSYEGGNAYWELETPKKMGIDFSGKTSHLSIKELDANLIGETSTGSFNISNSGGTFNLTTSTGEINIDKSTGSFCTATSTGMINVNRSDLNIKSNSAAGTVKIIETKGDENINSQTGDIYIDGCIGNFDLTSSTGAIQLIRPEGKFNCVTHTGDILLENPLLSSDAVFNTTTGGINLDLEVSPKYNMDAVTFSGLVELTCSGKFEGVRIEMVVDDSVGTIQSDLNIGEVIENYKTSKNVINRDSKQRFVKKIINPEITEPIIKIDANKGAVKIRSKN